MMNNEPEDEGKMLEVAKEAARKAGQILLNYFRKDISFDKKGDGSPVSIADKEAEEEIKRVILKEFPDHKIVGEESGVTGTGEISWHIDPLDGTSNFKEGFQFFCVSIGVEKEGEFIIGVVYNPLTDELFSALKGKGAFLNGKKINVNAKNMGDGKIIIDSSFKGPLAKIKTELQTELLKINSGMRLMGSSALQLAETARGTFICSISDNVKSYDFAAGIVLVNEAGGIVTDQFGNKPGSFSKVIVASNNRENHEEVIRITERIYHHYI